MIMVSSLFQATFLALAKVGFLGCLYTWPGHPSLDPGHSLITPLPCSLPSATFS